MKSAVETRGACFLWEDGAIARSSWAFQEKSRDALRELFTI